ncbi:MAG TPA: hypothetical protein DGT21_22790 [Armatimonadetes bacterium]|jgi:hypothetical protein|nr:hypothetical protein [Armatimonadota bacterium]
MDEQDEVYGTCERCHKPLFYGNACVTINRNIEQVDWSPEYPDGIVTVIDSTQLHIFCAECGNQVVMQTQPKDVGE